MTAAPGAGPAGTAAPANRSDVVRFAAVWSTSVISGVGSSVTSFVFGVYIYLSTGSEVSFAVGMVAAVVPAIIVGPFAGVVVDRFDRRWVLVLTDSVSLIAVGVVAYLMWIEQVQVWHLYLATAISATGGAFHLTAYAAMTPLLIPKRHLARANGLMQVSFAAQIAAPLVAAALLPTVGFAGVLLLDLATFSIAMVTLLVVRLPARVLFADRPGEPEPVLRDAYHGWRHLGERPGLRSLVLVMAGYNFFFAVSAVLVQPLILSFGDPSTLGVLMFAGGSGLFAGSLVMGAWGGPRRRIRGMALFMAIGGVALAAHALRPSAVLVGAAAFAVLFTLPVVSSAANTVLQVKVDPSALGRVMGTSHSLGRAATPIAYLLAAPLAEYVAGPAMAVDGALAGSLGQLIGTGPGRGIAAIILVDGLLLVAVGLLVLTLPTLRRVESALPDSLPDEPAVAPAPEPSGAAPAKPVVAEKPAVAGKPVVAEKPVVAGKPAVAGEPAGRRERFGGWEPGIDREPAEVWMPAERSARAAGPD